MSPDLSEIEAKLAAIESSSSGSESDRDLDQPLELTDQQADHIDKMLEEIEGERGDRLAEVSEIIHAEKAEETPEERQARRDRHELTPGETALLDLLTGGLGEVRR